MKVKNLLTVVIMLFFLPVISASGQIWVEAEQFQEKEDGSLILNL